MTELDNSCKKTQVFEHFTTLNMGKTNPIRFFLKNLSCAKEINTHPRLWHMYIVFGSILLCLMQILKVIHSRHCMHLTHGVNLD